MTSMILQQVDKSAEPDGCWVWTGYTRKGYGAIFLLGKTYAVHRIVFADIHGPIPEDMVVMHRCDNPPCCNPAHLKLATQRENMLDMFAKGRGVTPKKEAQPKPDKKPQRGSTHHNSKLTEDVVKELQYLHFVRGVSQKKLAEKYGVSQPTVSRAVSGAAWAHVDAVLS